jgi:hypothetical protein
LKLQRHTVSALRLQRIRVALVRAGARVRPVLPYQERTRVP